MSKTISLEEAYKLATKGPIYPKKAPPQFPHSANIELKKGDRVALVDPSPYWDTDHKTKPGRAMINAALLAHAFNNLGEAVEILKELRQLAYRESTARANGELGEPYLKKLVVRTDDILAKASTVEVPV